MSPVKKAGGQGTAPPPPEKPAKLAGTPKKQKSGKEEAERGKNVRSAVHAGSSFAASTQDVNTARASSASTSQAVNQAINPTPPEPAEASQAAASLSGSMITNQELMSTGYAGLQGSMLSAYQYTTPRFRWGPANTDYLVPTVLYIPRTLHEPPPPIDAFKEALPISPQPTSTETELSYTPKVTLAAHKHAINDPRYAVPPPPADLGYNPPPLLAVGADGNSSEGHVAKLRREGNVFASLPPTMSAWLGANVNLGSLDILQINPKAIEAMSPEGRDRLLDALEDHGTQEITRVTTGGVEELGELGPAATLALLMRCHGSEKGFAALIGARPMFAIPELLVMAKAPFKPENIPWIIYYSLPRMRMAKHLEQGFTAAAVASSVCSLLEQAYGKANGPNKVADANVLIKEYRESKAWLSVLPSLREEHPEVMNFHIGTMYALLLSGSMMYAFKVLKRDDNRRFWVKWGIKSIVTIALTAPTLHAAPLVAPIIVTIADKFLDGVSDPLAEKIIAKKDWVDSIDLFVTEFKRTLTYELAKIGKSAEADIFITGFETTLSLLKQSREMYRNQFSTHASLQVTIARHPYLQKFLDVAFSSAIGVGPLRDLIRGRSIK